MSPTYAPATTGEDTVMDVTIPADGHDEQIARAFFEEVDRRARIESAVVDYEERRASGRPYEDAIRLEDLRQSLS